MGATVISQGTREWLAELLEDGWTAEVVESQPIVHRYRLTLVDDLEESVQERVTPARVGVRATRDSSWMFFPCDSAGEAHDLLDRAVAMADAA